MCKLHRWLIHYKRTVNGTKVPSHTESGGGFLLNFEYNQFFGDVLLADFGDA